MKYFLILLVLALIASSCGFYKYVWFISIGYGAAVALIGAGFLVLFSGNLTAGTVLQCVLFIAYGCRLPRSQNRVPSQDERRSERE